LPTPFSQTYRALAADRFGARGLVLAVSITLLAGWVWWAWKATVPLYEVSREARVEQDAASYPVQAPFAGKLVHAALALGKAVHKGDVLAEIDAEPDRFAMRQEETRIGSLDTELARLRTQQQAEEAARGAERQSARAAQEEAVNRQREAETAAAFAEQEERRIKRLRDEKLIAEREYDRAVSESARLRAVVQTAKAAANRIESDQITRDKERDVRLQRIASDIARLEGEKSRARVSVGRIGYEIERRKVRAPVDGRLAEVAVLHVGAVLEEGARLAAIVPEGRLRVVAQFPAPAAFGRIRAGQSARMRLDGFPWAEFGTLRARVERAAGEVRDGKVRVEMEIVDSPGLRAPLQHGMPGSIEVEVERITPARLLLRAAGQLVTSPREASGGSD